MFYDNFIKFCNSVGKSPSAVAKGIGIEKSTVTRWKKGATPTDANLQKLADYFGCSISELTSEAPSPAVSESDTVSEGTIKAAFFEGGEDLTQEEMDELWEDAKDYIQYKLEQRRSRSNDQ